MSRALLLAILSLAAVACSEASYRNAETFEPDADADPDDSDADVRDMVEPAFWSLDGQLTVVDGQIAIDESLLVTAFQDGSGALYQDEDGSSSSCELQVVEAVQGPAFDEDTDALIGWWQLTVEPAEGVEVPCTRAPPIPELVGDTEGVQLLVGIGPLDPRLEPTVEASGLSPDLPLYGLYVLHPSASGDVLYVMGLAGTEDQFSGDGAVVDEAPAPDGAYTLQTLLLMPIPGADRG